ncbi:MAG: energy-coupling factor transporter transmembrane component T, partial [Lachnospiraceae bacterium]|nr:energy-coupling factor transporter transmembrane component T [Lachnospiraceae bacterium]
MLRDITLGQYYPADSVIHKLDPRVKLAGTMVYLITLFAFRSVASYVAATIFLGVMIHISKVPPKFMFRGLKSIIFLLLFTAVFNLFLIPGNVVFQIWKIRITDKGIETAAFMAIRLVYLIVGSSLMTLTTTPNDLTDGLEKAMSPLKAVHVPVHEISMMMSIALRFIPILMEETDKIMRAQIARG